MLCFGDPFRIAKEVCRWHQDVKPDNILVVSNGARCPYEWQFKLGDLGLSYFNSEVGMLGGSTASAAHGTKTYG